MRIFVSYAHQDKQMVDVIVDRLTLAGHEIWIDQLKLRPGDNISRKIEDGIETSDAVLVVVSANSLSSKWVQQEFSLLALSEISKHASRVIPVLIDSSSVPSYLLKYLYIDLNKDLEAGLSSLIHSLEVIKRKDIARPRLPPEKRNETHTSQIASLGAALKSGRLTLVCGAGTSVKAGIPVWNELLLSLLSSIIERLSKDHSLKLGSDAAEEFNKRHGASSLILGKYLKNNLGKDFGKQVRDALYRENPTTCDLIDAIVDVSRPQRSGKPLDSIITFNFDALIEESLSAANVQNRAIYTEAIKHDPNELPVYHVHGYLPRTGKIPNDNDIVFSEDAYHGQFIDPFSWSNLIQLNKLTQNTCLFVGISLTDPNMRRLLDVAWRKNPDKSVSHYILKKVPRFGSADDELDDLARLLEEQDANALGINVIWVDSYDQIPTIIRSLR
ncbi:TIR domain-containing protein [Pectobacteriaceae bacterium CE70]|nr:TIR domain-containing protein [Pectobacteriaceae bacterium CE70]WJY09468.1 TIR domain-containing protein [Pectobacteriaceae bacterium C80]